MSSWFPSHGGTPSPVVMGSATFEARRQEGPFKPLETPGVPGHRRAKIALECWRTKTMTVDMGNN